MIPLPLCNTNDEKHPIWIADQSAPMLMDAVLSSTSETRVEHYEACLRIDPGFCLWTAAIAYQSQQVVVNDISVAAKWLEENQTELIWRIASIETEQDSIFKLNKKDRQSIIDHVTMSAKIAILAAQVAETTKRCEPQEAFYLATIDQSLAQQSTKTSAFEIISPEMQQAISAIAKTDHCHYLAACVCDAISLLNNPRAVASKQVDLNDCNQFAQQVQQHWAASEPKWQNRLILFFSKIQQMELSEKHYEEKLLVEKLDAMKELAYGASHEINNPLANISTRAQTLLRDETDPERRKKLATINRQAFRAHEMISDLMLFARPPQPEFATVDLNRVIQQVVDELQPWADEQATALIWQENDLPIMIQADFQQLCVAVKAVINNSLEALAGGGQIEIYATFLQIFDENIERPQQKMAEISIADNGPGMNEREQRHLFDPFFSGREAGRGLGFGLTKCWRIVTNHQGQVVVDTKQGFGTTISLLLPVDRM